MKLSLNTLACLTLAVTILGQVSSAQANTTTGKNVSVVTYAHPSSGTYAGYFMQTGTKSWVETAPDGKHNFTEEFRTPSVVYLRKTDGASIQINFVTKEIYIAHPGDSARVLYNVLEKYATNGLVATWATYARPGSSKIAGYFLKTGANTWIEQAPDRKWNFTEVSRDEWSVYLKKEDGALIQLNLWTKEVFITYASGARESLYTVVGAD